MSAAERESDVPVHARDTASLEAECERTADDILAAVRAIDRVDGVELPADHPDYDRARILARLRRDHGLPDA